MSAENLPTRFLLEHHSGYRLGREELLVQKVAEEHGREVEVTSLSQIRRGKVLPGDDTAVVGSIPFVKAALVALGQKLPEPNPYPAVLHEYLYRTVQVLPMKVALERIERSGTALFIKPAQRWKSFTGCVPADGRDIRLNGASRNQDVWVSTPVHFVSEWRAYVLNGRVRHVAWYDGLREFIPESEVVHQAVSRYVERGAPVGFAIDFGVLSTGETALVEVNDGFSVGAYEGIAPLTYTMLIANRWFEMACDKPA